MERERMRGEKNEKKKEVIRKRMYPLSSVKDKIGGQTHDCWRFPSTPQGGITQPTVSTYT